MFDKKLIWAFLFIFIFLSVSALFENMPAPKNKRVYVSISWILAPTKISISPMQKFTKPTTNFFASGARSIFAW